MNKKYFATVKHHSIVGHWQKIPAKSLTAAKRLATLEFGGGYLDHVIHLVEVDPGQEDRLNDLPAYTRRIGDSRWRNPV